MSYSRDGGRGPPGLKRETPRSGNCQFREALQFDDKTAADRFSAAALAAVRRLIKASRP
jgi:hypothetical protein